MAPTAVRSVVVVEDDATFCKSLTRLLSSHGLCVSSFASAEEFLRGISATSIGCLILDINLPGMSGLELQKHLSNDSWQPIPLIFLTASDEPGGGMRAQAMQRGAYAFFDKPFCSEEFIAAVLAALASINGM